MDSKEKVHMLKLSWIELAKNKMALSHSQEKDT